MAKMYYDADANLDLLKGKTIAVMGFGSQGHAQAQNLHESGCKVIVGIRKPIDDETQKEWDAVIAAGLQPMSVAEAAQAADIIHILLPDQTQAQVYNNEIKPYLQEGNALDFPMDSIFILNKSCPRLCGRFHGSPQGPRPSGQAHVCKGRGSGSDSGRAGLQRKSQGFGLSFCLWDRLYPGWSD